MNGTAFWQEVLAELRRDASVGLVLVAHNTRHSPGTRGARLAVTGDGRTWGTIGGGIMEHEAVLRARARLAEAPRPAPTLEVLTHRRDPTVGTPSGLICAGQQTNLTVVLGPEHRAVLEDLIEHQIRDAPGRLCIERERVWIEAEPATTSLPSVRLRRAGYGTEAPGEGFHGPAFDGAFDGPALDGPALDGPALEGPALEGPALDGPALDGPAALAGPWRYEEQLLELRRVAILGGGHCARALSRTLDMLGMQVTVVEVRAEVPTFAGNPWARHKHLVDDFVQAGKRVDHPSLTCLVVMTASYPTDVRALLGVAGRGFPFVGLMGSAVKLQQIRRDLRAAGVDPTEIDQWHAPVGLPIASHTPEEIAISIAAQLIAERPRLFPLLEGG